MRDFIEIQYRQYGRDLLYRRKHSHSDCYEFIQTVTDSGTVLIRDRVYPMKHGAVYLINAVNIHCTNPDDIDTYERNKLIVEKNFADRLLSMMELDAFESRVLRESGGGCYELDTETAAKLDEEFKLCAKASNGGGFAKAAVVGSLARILLTLAGRDAGEAVSATHISRILDYISRHICEPITVEVIAAGVNLSKYYLCRMFRDKTGMTLMEYILERRLSMAKERLSESDSTILEIAADCGFSGGSYFCRVFREREGMTPREYRKKYRAD